MEGEKNEEQNCRSAVRNGAGRRDGDAGRAVGKGAGPQILRKKDRPFSGRPERKRGCL